MLLLCGEAWGSVCFTFGVKKPEGVEHLFCPWLRSFSSKQRNLVLIGLAAICWVVWISRNDLFFQKSQYMFILQVIFRGTFWIRSWSVLSKQEGRTILKDGCRALEVAALELFHKFGWNALNVLITSFTLWCNLHTLIIVVHCKSAWSSRCELCGLCAVLGMWVVSVWLQAVPWTVEAGTHNPLLKKPCEHTPSGPWLPLRFCPTCHLCTDLPNTSWKPQHGS
jgi:hypothetical protein